MCSMGTSVCEGGKWAACQGNTLQAQSIVVSSIDRQSRHVRHKVVACPQTADGGDYFCDPNRCPPVVEGSGDVDAAGFVESDAGVSLVPNCTALSCQVQNCVGNPFDASPDAYAPATTITGKVYDPAGVNPLNNVSVFIPNDPTVPLPAFVPGPTCDPCTYAGGASPPSTVAVTQTGPDGSFTLTNVPSGTNIPIVVQVGKWRRKITLANVTPCAVNQIRPGTLHLPRNQTDGDNNHADLPKMAFVVGGGPDDLECLLLKMGLDPNEFGSLNLNTTRALHYYESPDKPSTPLDPAFGGPSVSGQLLWTSPTNLALYDLVILGCDGNDYTDNGRSPGGYTNLTNYANGGGRVFLSHYSRSWMMNNTPWSPAANSWPASWALSSLTATIDQSTPQGQAFEQWLVNVHAITDAGTMAIQTPHQSSVSPLGPGVRSLMNAGPGQFPQPDGSTQFSPNFEFDTPYGGANACGRVVYADFHVSSADKLSPPGADAGTSTPIGCSTSAQCGYGSTCPAPTGGLGTCNANPCYPPTTQTDCNTTYGATHYTCAGATMGTCACNVSSDCPANGGTCVNGLCSQATCYRNSDCPSGPIRCVNSVQGRCAPDMCTTTPDCAFDGTEKCLNGLCNGCVSSADCPGNETCTINGSQCTGNDNYAPYACAQSSMTPQEAALEYELLNLGACVVPVAPAALAYTAATFTEDLVSSCATGQIPVWRELDWYSNVPNTSSISFYAQTAAQPADGGPPDYSHAVQVPLYTDTTSFPPPPPDGGAGNPGRVLIDVGPGGPIVGDAAPPIDAAIPGAFQLAMPPQSSLDDLRLIIKMTPTADMMSTPTLYSWTVKWDCVPRE
jgi:hypothetical protein